MQPVQTDWQLVERIQDGNDCAFDTLMLHYKRPILNFIYRMIGDATEAEDIALDVFAHAYRALTSSGFQRGTAEFSTWLFQIARHAALDYVRYQKRHPTEPLTEQEDETGHAISITEKTAHDDAVAHETGTQIAAAIAELPEDQRTAIVLSEYEDRSHTEIAAIMKTSAKSVEARLYRARQFLRQRLASLLT